VRILPAKSQLNGNHWFVLKGHQPGPVLADAPATKLKPNAKNQEEQPGGKTSAADGIATNPARSPRATPLHPDVAVSGGGDSLDEFLDKHLVGQALVGPRETRAAAHQLHDSNQSFGPRGRRSGSALIFENARLNLRGLTSAHVFRTGSTNAWQY
jgi:hypothetical protein